MKFGKCIVAVVTLKGAWKYGGVGARSVKTEWDVLSRGLENRRAVTYILSGLNGSLSCSDIALKWTAESPSLPAKSPSPPCMVTESR